MVNLVSVDLRAGLLFAGLFCASVWPVLTSAEQVAVRVIGRPELSIGQGYLLKYGENCFVMMPTHVANEAKGVASLLRKGRKPLLGEASDFVDLGDDLSVGVVTGKMVRSCGRSSSVHSRAVDKHVEKSGLATLRWVNPDGSQANIAMAVLDHGEDTLMRVEPASKRQQIRKGQSGSLLIANAEPVGMLLSVSSRTGRAEVIRMDAMLIRMEKHMSSIGNAPSRQNRAELVIEPSVNIAAEANGGSVVEWSAEPVDAESRATNIIDGSIDSEWQVQAERGPVSVSIALAEKKKHAIARIVIVVSAERLNAHPARVTLMVNLSSTRKRWRTVISKDLHFDETGRAELKFPPTWGRDVRLEFVGQANQSIVAVAEVMVNTGE